MSALKVTGKGQITLRKDVLRHLGIEPGARVEATPMPGGRVELHAAARKGDIRNFFGALKDPSEPPLTLEEIDRLIVEGWSKDA